MDRFLNHFGYRLVPLTESSKKGNSFEAAISRLNSDTISNIETVIDIGASDGQWSKKMMKYLPETNYLSSKHKVFTKVHSKN